MKIFAIAGSKEFYKIGEDFDNTEWYAFNADLASTMETINKGDVVDMKWEINSSTKKRTITSITKTAEKSFKSQGGATPSSYGKTSSDVQASIIRQSVGHMVSRTLVGIGANIPAEELTTTIDTLYAHYLKKVTE